MGFLDGLFETKALSRGSRNAIPRATGSSIVRSSGGGNPLPIPGQWDINQAIQYAMEQVMWVFRAVDVIAENQASVPIKLRHGLEEETGEWVDDPNLYRLLNIRANTYESAKDFRYRLSANLLLSRRGAFVEIVRDQAGRPRELHILPAGTTNPIPDPKKFVSGYRVHRSDNNYNDLPPENVIWIKAKPHPTDPYQQMTPLTSLGVSVETDWLAHQFNRTYLQNGGRQGLLIALKGQVSIEDAEEIKRRFSGGPMRAGEATVIEGDGIDVKDMSGRPTDVQWSELMDTSKEEILMGFGVPESVMGNASGRTFDNADAERENFWQDTMRAHCKSISQSLDVLTGNTEDDTILAYDYSTIDVLQRTKRRDREEFRSEVAAGLRTIDEYLEAVGREKSGVPGTGVLINNSLGVAFMPEDEEEREKITSTLVKVGEPPAPEEGAEGGGMGALGMGSGESSLAARMPMGGAQAAEDDDWYEKSMEDEMEHHTITSEDLFTKAASLRGGGDPKGGEAHPYLQDALMDEKTLEGVLLAWDTQQEEIITDRLNHAKLRKGTRFWEYKEGEEPEEFKALDAEYAVDPGRWALDLRRSAARVIDRTVTREARRMAREITGQRNKALEGLIPSEIDRAAILNRAEDEALALIEDAANAQMARVMDKITAMADEGATLKEIDAEVRRTIGARSTWRKRVVQSAVQRATEGVRMGVATNSGRKMVKYWIAQHDDRVRKWHRKAHGQRRLGGSRFRVGPAWLRYPGDPQAPLALTINCRCYVHWTVA